jgi:hypothetical protein
MRFTPESKCLFCGTQTQDLLGQGYCETCWENVIQPAFDHVESVPPDHPQSMTWHGWALREAFIAGAKYQFLKVKP